MLKIGDVLTSKENNTFIYCVINIHDNKCDVECIGEIKNRQIINYQRPYNKYTNQDINIFMPVSISAKITDSQKKKLRQIVSQATSLLLTIKLLISELE
jgi:hypothetical protein